MHEFALAESVILSAKGIAEKNEFIRIRVIELRVGELQQMSEDAFALGLKTMAQERGPVFEGARFEVKVEKASFACRVCGCRWSFANACAQMTPEEAEYVHFIPEVAHGYLSCPGCESSDYEVASGRGLWLDAVRGDVRD